MLARRLHCVGDCGSEREHPDCAEEKNKSVNVKIIYRSEGRSVNVESLRECSRTAEQWMLRRTTLACELIDRVE